MLEGRLIEIRPLQMADADFLAELANAPQVRHNVVGWDWPIARDAQRGWLEGALRDPRNRRFTVVDPSTGSPIGLTGLWEVDWHNRSAMFAVKLMPGTAPKGAGSDSMKLMAAWSFYEAGLRRLHGTILDSNPASIAMSTRKCGWRVEGRECEAVLRRGEWCDLIRIAQLRSDFDSMDYASEYIERVCGQSLPLGHQPRDSYSEPKERRQLATVLPDDVSALTCAE